MVDTRFSVSIQIMMALAYCGEDELSSSETLAKSLKTNPTFIRKLVSGLVEHELVQSYRGKGGGIKLAKSPDKISLNDIYLASTGEKRLISIHKKPEFPEPKILGNFKPLGSKKPMLSVNVDDFVAANPNDIKPGMEVIHLKFGQGKVMSVDERLVASIVFDGLDENQEKRIMLQFAKLQIVT